MDYSSSMADDLEDMEIGVKAFIDAMKHEDKAAIIKFYYQPQLMIGLTSDKSALYNAIDTPPNDLHCTNIYDTVFEAVNLAAGGEGRLAVILLTNGEHHLRDTSDVAQHTLEDAIANATQKDVAIFTIALDLRDDTEITTISEETGGIYFPVFNSSVVGETYMSLFELLEEQHLFVYTSSAIDGLEHSMQITGSYGGVIGEGVALFEILWHVQRHKFALADLSATTTNS